MESFENNFQEYLILKNRARNTGVPIGTLIRFKERGLRYHLMTLHAQGSPLSELAEYVVVFYSAEVTPQQLRRILQRSDRETWSKTSESYRRHRNMKKKECVTRAQGA